MPAHTSKDIARYAVVVFVDDQWKPFNFRLRDVDGQLVVHIELPRGTDTSPSAQSARIKAAVAFAGRYLADDIEVVHAFR